MYKLHTTIESNLWYPPSIHDDILYGVTFDRNLDSYDISNLEKIETIATDVGYHKVYENHLFITNQKGLRVYDIKAKKIIQTLDGLSVLGGQLVKQNLICTYDNNFIIKVNYLTGKELWKVEGKMGFGHFLIENKLIYGDTGYYSKRIFCINLENGKEIWNQNIELLTKGKSTENTELRIRKPIIKSGNIVTILLSDGQVFGIDHEDGTILWEQKIKESVIYLKEYNGLLHQLDMSNYTIVDSQNGNIILAKEMKEEYEKNSLKSYSESYLIDENHIYFIDYFKSKIGIMNKMTGKILEILEPELEDDVSTPPHLPLIHNENLIIVDSKGSMHIYHKQKTT